MVGQTAIYESYILCLSYNAAITANPWDSPFNRKCNYYCYFSAHQHLLHKYSWKQLVQIMNKDLAVVVTSAQTVSVKVLRQLRPLNLSCREYFALSTRAVSV